MACDIPTSIIHGKGAKLPEEKVNAIETLKIASRIQLAMKLNPYLLPPKPNALDEKCCNSIRQD
jgi:hypothetical protein